jgi:hypothetical protein
MTPVGLTAPQGSPLFPLAAIDPSGNLKQQAYLALLAHGVTCERILEILDEIRADPAAIASFFEVR